MSSFPKKHREKPATTTSSVNSSTQNVTSTRASSSTQVASTASLKSGPDESSKHRNHNSHNVSTNSSSTIVGSSSNSARGGKDTDSGNGSHQEKKSSHKPDTTSSQASVSQPRSELKHASKSFLSRTKIDPEEKKMEERLEKEHKDLEAQRQSDYTFVTLYNNRNLEKLRYKLAKERLEDLKNNSFATRKQEEEVELKRNIRNEADAKLERLQNEDEEIARKQRLLLNKMREGSPYRTKVEKMIRKKEKKTQEWEKEKAKEKERAEQAAKKAEEAELKRIANEEEKKDEARRKNTELTKYTERKFEKSQYNNKKKTERREN